jgi:uncharacterized surface protein with fasciclin (FAS1) repeats
MWKRLSTVLAASLLLATVAACQNGKGTPDDQSDEMAKASQEMDKKKKSGEKKWDEEKKKAEETAKKEMDKAKKGGTIVEVAAKAGDFNTLVSAIKAAGLVDTLSGDGPFTVFAPTDAAFKKLPEGTLDSLLKPANKGKLQSILTYHVLSGKVMAADVEPGMVSTVEGSDAELAVSDGSVTYAGATVTKTDIKASNGVIHVIDTVVMPPKDDDSM